MTSFISTPVYARRGGARLDFELNVCGEIISLCETRCGGRGSHKESPIKGGGTLKEGMTAPHSQKSYY